MKLLLRLLLVLMMGSAYAQSNLPACPEHGSRWTHCVSTTTYSNGDVYAIEYFLDKLAGGSITYANGKKYVGEILSSSPHGTGTLTLPNGDKYTGKFIHGSFSGLGTFTYADGSPPREGIWLNNDLVVSENNTLPQNLSIDNDRKRLENEKNQLADNQKKNRREKKPIIANINSNSFLTIHW